MFGECIVAAVMCRNGHDSTGSVAGQYIVADPDGHGIAGERVDGIRTAECTGNGTVGDTFTFRTLFSAFQISVYFLFLLRSRQLCDQFAFGSQNHESNTEHGVGTGCKDGKFEVAIFYLELDFGSFAAADPVTLCFFQRVRPVDRVQSVQQAL